MEMEEPLGSPKGNLVGWPDNRMWYLVVSLLACEPHAGSGLMSLAHQIQ